MQSKISYYASGHTGKGKVNLLTFNLSGIKRIVILKHPLAYVKSGVIKQLIKYFKLGTAEYISNPVRENYLDGVISHEKSLAIISEDISEELVGRNEVSAINLEDFTKDLSFSAYENEKTIDKIDQLRDRSCDYFAKGLSYHEQLEQVYISEMDFNKADQLAAICNEKLFHHRNHRKKTTYKPIVKERFFGTNTPDGITNHLAELIAPLNKRIFIKGRAGTGKSVFMKRVLEKAIFHGYDVEVYRCSFDPASVDMVLIRSLSCCLFDSTAPHELFPTRKTDTVIDLYELTVTPGTEKKYNKEISRLTDKYKREMKNGLDTLAKIKPLLGEDLTKEYYLSDLEIEKVVKIIEGDNK